MELLEDRTLLAAVSWISPSDGLWNVGANWDSGSVPQLGDEVTIDVAGDITVTLSGAGAVIDNLQSMETLVISGGSSLDVANGSQLANLTVNDGTLTGSGDVVITNQFDWNGGGLAGAAGTTATISTGGSLSISGDVTLNTRTLSLENSVQTIWSGGDITLEGGAAINNDGDFDVHGDQDVTGDGVFNNDGNFTSIAGSRVDFPGVPFNNTATGSVLVEAGGSVQLTGGGISGGEFISETPDAGTGLGFYNVHTLTSDSKISGPGRVGFQSGVFSVASEYNVTGETLIINNADFEFTGTMQSVGHFLLVDGASTANFHATPLSPDRLKLADALETTLISGELNVSEELIWEVGTIAGTGDINVPSGATLQIGRDGNVPGETWTLADGRVLNHAGQGTLRATNSNFNGHFVMEDGAQFNNSGSIIAQHVGRLNFEVGGSPGAVFNNSGDFTSVAGARVDFPAVPFNNQLTGTVRVEPSGSVQLLGGGVGSGEFISETPDAGTGLGFYDMYTLTSDSKISGAGRVGFQSGVFSVASEYNVTGETLILSGADFDFTGDLIDVGYLLHVSNGSVADFGSRPLSPNRLVLERDAAPTLISGELNVSEEFIWEVGTVAGTGDINVLPGANLHVGRVINLSEFTWTLADGRILNHQGVGTLDLGTPNADGYFVFEDGAQFNNAGSFIAQNTQPVIFESNGATGAVFNNSGNFTVRPRPGATNIGSPVDNKVTFSDVPFYNMGIVRVQPDADADPLIKDGVLLLESGGEASGEFTIESTEHGTGIGFNYDYTLTSDSKINGPGRVGFSFGDFSVASEYNVTGETLILSGADFDFTGDLIDVGYLLHVANGSVANFYSRPLSPNRLVVCPD